MVFLDTDRDRTAWGFGTVLLQLTWLAIFHRKLDRDDLVVVAIKRRRPTQAFTSSRARGFLCLPINVETSSSKALLLFGLPLVISPGGCDQIDPVLLATLHKLLGFGIIGVSQMLFRQQILFLQGLMDHRRHIHIPVPSSARLHMGNQSRGVLITIFGQNNFLVHTPRDEYVYFGGHVNIRNTDNF